MPSQAVHLHLGRAQRHIDCCRWHICGSGLKKQAKTHVRCRRELLHSKGFERLADLGAHVPHSAHAVSAAGHEDVEAGVQRQRVHPAEVAMVLPDHLHKSHQARSGHKLPARMHTLCCSLLQKACKGL